MDIETEFPSLTSAAAISTAEDIAFYQDNYEIAVNRIVAARGPNEFLGRKSQICRFCSRSAPDVKFRKEAHAIPALAGNGTLLSYFECDECNSRFSAFEDDLGKLTLVERVAGQVLGKGGAPSAKTKQKLSRIDLGPKGFDIKSHEGDPIAEIDHEAKTLTISVTPQPYRPLGVFKALVKVALTLMDEQDVSKVSQSLRWLRAADVTTDQIDDGTRYICIRTFTPGPAPFTSTRAVLLRRKEANALGPAFIFLLAFGNLSFQIIVPAPDEDKRLIGKQIVLRPVPVFAFLMKVESVETPDFGRKTFPRPQRKEHHHRSFSISTGSRRFRHRKMRLRSSHPKVSNYTITPSPPRRPTPTRARHLSARR